MRDSIFGYAFQDPTLLDRALTTPSCRNLPGVKEDNQRLEFLGDAVLELLSTNEVFARLQDCKEGELTVRRSRMVSTVALCAAAERLDFVSLLKVGKGCPPLPKNSKTVADAMEAVVGAAYLDGGMDAALAVYEAMDLYANSEQDDALADPKTELQHFAQAHEGRPAPQYRLLETSGTSNNPTFKVEVSVVGLGSAQGVGHSKQEAESKAALGLLNQLK